MNMDLHSALTSLQELEDLVAGAYGPEGRAVLVQQQTGQFYITRSGNSILSSVYTESNPDVPTKHLLIDCARKVHESLGDGVKSFIIMTSSLLKSCESLGNPVHVARQLSVLQRQLSLLCYQQPEFPVPSVDVLEERNACFEKLIHTFFNTRFPVAVHNVLSSVLCKWIVSNSNNILETEMQPYSCRTLQVLLKNFPFLCDYKDGESRAVSESKVLQGYRVRNHPINLTVSGPRKIHILMLGDSDSPDSGSFDDVDVQCEVDKFILDLETHGCEDNTKGEKNLLITSAILSELTIFRLRRLGVAVLQGILPEEVRYLYSCLFVVQQEQSKEVVVNVKLETDCGIQYTRLQLPNVHQLILCAPTSELCTEYACACESAIKLCIVAASYVLVPDCYPSVVRAGGYFERELQTCLSQKFGRELLDPLICGVGNRAELLAWHEQRLKNLQKISDSCSTRIEANVSESIKRRTSEAEDNIDVLSSTSLSGESKSNTSLNTVLCRISDACAGVNSDVIGAISRALLAIQRLSQTVSDTEMPENASCMDSIGLKLSILQHSIGATISLLRVCGVIHTKTKVTNIKL